jgi:hypothetical protein
MSLVKTFFIFFLVPGVLWAADNPNHLPGPCVMMFFDMGNTLVDTSTRDAQGEILKIYYFRDTVPYLRSLVQSGFELGMIINVPPEWGVLGLRNYVDQRWDNRNGGPFPWQAFGNNILVPSHPEWSKPGSHMFCEAVKIAQQKGCMAVFQGEDFLVEPKERLAIIKTARRAGMVSVLVNKRPVPTTEHDESERDNYLPANQVLNYIRAHPPRQEPGFCYQRRAGQ